ncbi:MAG: hypothetical protein GY783_06320 [Gammaproteobacteria bacterium]|nr:hypothetical protein [Gammaproteobacteria bacterium]
MKLENQHNSPLANHTTLKESHTSRFNLPVRHPALWRFLVEEILSSPMRIHRYRSMSARMFEDMVNEIDGKHCR